MKADPSDACLDPSHVAALYQQHAPVLFAYLHRHTGSWEDAEDLLLEVFLAALKDRQLGLLPASSQVAWLQRVAQNKVADHYRRAFRRASVPIEQVEATLLEDARREPDR